MLLFYNPDPSEYDKERIKKEQKYSKIMMYISVIIPILLLIDNFFNITPFSMNEKYEKAYFIIIYFGFFAFILFKTNVVYLYLIERFERQLRATNKIIEEIKKKIT